MALPIADYALIGDRATAALIGTNGSIDWLCLPRFDSPACFSALLGSAEHGRWLLTPSVRGEEPGHRAVRRYLGASTLLETTFISTDGQVELLDLMPTGDERADVVRRLRCTKGRMRIRHEWVVRFDYGQIVPWVCRQTSAGKEVIVATAGPDKVMLAGPRLPVAAEGDRRHQDEFEMTEGQEMCFTMTWMNSWRDLPLPLGFEARIEQTRSEQEQWARRCRQDLPHLDLVRRSLTTLRAMTVQETGGIVAAPTTSLPEALGGERNWDYRYCWLRDAALTLKALLGSGGLPRVWLTPDL